MNTRPMCPLTLLSTLAVLLGCDPHLRELPSAPVALTSQVAGDQEDNAPQYSDWSAPVNLGPIVNSPSTDLEASISKDGLSLYIATARSGNFDIWVSQRASENDHWGPPQNLGPAINTGVRDQAPFLSLDGHRLYLFSDREGGFGGIDVYVSRRRDKRDDFGWEAPKNLGSEVNSSFNDGPAVYFEDDAGTATLYFGSNRPGGIGGADIYASTLQPDGTFGPAVLVPELSSPRRDRVLGIRRDGLELFLASDRPGSLGTGTFDVWVATRASTSDPWSTPVNLGPIVNTADDDGGAAALSFDGTALYITSNRPGGSGSHDVWVTTRSKIKGSG